MNPWNNHTCTRKIEAIRINWKTERTFFNFDLKSLHKKRVRAIFEE